MTQNPTSKLPAALETPKPEPLRFRDLEDGELEQLTSADDAAGAIQRMFGVASNGTAIGTKLLAQIVHVVAPVTDDKMKVAARLNEVAQLLEELAPRDATEGLLVQQMVVCHFVAMRCLRLASHPDQTFDGREAYYNRGTKLLRTFAKQMETLKKYRSKGKQTVVVKHVHVHEGGQAIVGSVSQEAPQGVGGGGGS